MPVANEGVPAQTTEEAPPEPKQGKPKKEKKAERKTGTPQGVPAAAPDEPQTDEDPEPASDNAHRTTSGGKGATQPGGVRKEGGSGGERLDGDDPGVVTDPPPEPPQPEPEPEPPVVIDPPPEEPPCPTPSACPPDPPPCIPGANCPRVPSTPPNGPPTRP